MTPTSRTPGRALSPLRGLGSTGAGVAVAGLSTFVFLTLAARALGAEDFGLVSTLWALVFTVGPGLFLPVQQELSRVVGAQRDLDGGGHAVRVATAWSAGLVLLVVIATAALWVPATDRLFPGQPALLLCLLGATVGAALTFVARGVASGRGDFAGFGLLVSGEAALRLVMGVVVLVLLPTPVGFGVAIALAPFASVLLVSGVRRAPRLAPGHRVPRRELRAALLWLTAGSVLAQLAANAPPLVVQALGDEGSAATGRFMSALLVARLPIFFFQAVQATLIPNFSALVSAQRHDEFRSAVRRLTLLCAALVAVVTVGAYAVGPWAVSLLFGDGFEVDRRTITVLAGASGLYLLAAGLGNAAIAARRHRLTAAAWLAACAVFALVVALVDDLLLRVELGYLAGTLAAVAVLLLTAPRWTGAGRSGPG